MAVLTELSLHSVYIFFGGLVLIRFLYSQFAAQDRLPSTLPWVGRPKGLFAGLRGKINSFFNLRTLLDEGYYKYSKRGHAFVVPSFFGPPHVVIPPADIPWFLDLPDNVVSALEAQVSSLQADYTLLDSKLVVNPLHAHVVRRDLTRQLGSMIVDIMDELSASFDLTWGTDTEGWKEICLWDNMIDIIARTSNRVFVGKPLCRNTEYLKYTVKFAEDVPIAIFGICLFPKFLLPLAGLLFTLPNRYHAWKCAKYLVPVIEKRLSDRARKRQDPDYAYEVPSDFLEWQIQESLNSPDPTERTPTMMFRRMMVVNFAAIHTSTIAIVNTIFDLISSDPQKGYLQSLGAEAARCLAEENGVWNKAALAKMTMTDSAVREGMRHAGFLPQALHRVVAAKDGLVLKDGTHLPKGTVLSSASYSIHHDDDVYANANAYDPFRFSDNRTSLDRAAAGASANTAADGPGIHTTEQDAAHQHRAEILRGKNNATVTTSPSFLAFSHGRHACPGRFFAANEIKLLLAYLTLNYELEPLETRPADIWMATNCIPNLKATIRVRRRKTPL
ncbi:MAG: hypothetical protein M1825_006494 [Sarcosagium campestre]|nr:MAG: hypothetical protein M1825_006494 [Sarcosagium campestre]